MDPAPTQYIERDGAALAYQVVGDGPHDILLLGAINQHLDLSWTDPDLHHLFEHSARFSRTVYVQERGVGLSERISYIPTVEQYASDVLAVMDQVGMSRATLVGVIPTCAAVSMVAAQHPDRVQAIVLVNPVHTLLPLGEDAARDADCARLVSAYDEAFDAWGTGATVPLWDSVLDTPRNRRLMALLERTSATPAAAKAYWRWVTQLDYTDVLKAVQVPARVLYIGTSAYPEYLVRRAAELLPEGDFHVLPPTPPGSSIGQAFRAITDHIEDVATGGSRLASADRYLGTVLFTDVVASTELLSRIGDTAYSDLRSAHERHVRLAVERRGGELVTVMGDGTLSVLTSPSEAVRCAEEIRSSAAETDLRVRCGIHTGELVRDGRNVTGMTVHIGARVGSAADEMEILVSRTVRDLVVGSGLSFRSRGTRELKGVPGSWEVFALSDVSAPVEEISGASAETRRDRMALRTARRMPALTRASLRLANAIERRRAGSATT